MLTPWSEKDNAELLLDDLATLIQSHGAETFLAAPLLERSEACFPDPWEPTLLGFCRLVHRLHHWAGIGSARFFPLDERVDQSSEHHESTVPAQVAFLGYAEDNAALVYQVEVLGSGELLVGALCFEVARAFLEVRGGRDPYRGSVGADLHSTQAQRQAAVATVYLGFGVLSAEAAHSYRADGHFAGSMAYTSWVHSRAGALPAGDLTFLLAAQLTLRTPESGQGEEELSSYWEPILSQLPMAQRRDVSTWLDRLAGHQEALAKRLGVDPNPVESNPWPDVPALSEDLEALCEEAEIALRQPLRSVVVPRLVKRYRLFFALGASAIGALAGLISGSLVVSLALAAGCGLGGVGLGAWRRSFYCGACEMMLKAKERACPRCGATLGHDEPYRERRIADMEDDEDDELEAALAEQALRASSPDRLGILEREEE